MDSVNVIQPHALLQKRSEAASHNTVADKKNTLNSAFSDYLFGPLSSTGGSTQSGGAKASMALTNAKQSVEARS